MFPFLRTIIWKTSKTITSTTIRNSLSLFHSLPNTYCAKQITHTKELLAPATALYIPNCGFKVKGLLKRRCKDCYFIRREDRLFVICKTHPRHKQMQMRKKEKNTWILSHATQSKFRPW